MAAWNSAFGANTATGCKKGAYCAQYGPPRDYLTPNEDGALGGNPGFKAYLVPNTDPDNPSIFSAMPSESGWKDTADADAEQVLRILVRWTPSDVPLTPKQSYAGQNFYEFDPTQGYYVWHCHHP